jgi:hypothetical protein
MKITQSKIERELEKKGWKGKLELRDIVLIRDVVYIINEQLKFHKGITIK